jgi:hypothetical protein
MKRFVPKDGGGRNPTVDFKGEARSNETHASTTDPEARLYKKSPGDKAALGFMGHAGYRQSLKIRKRIENIWTKTVVGLRKTRWVGRAKVGAEVLMTVAAYNLTRIGVAVSKHLGIGVPGGCRKATNPRKWRENRQPTAHARRKG